MKLKPNITFKDEMLQSYSKDITKLRYVFTAYDTGTPIFTPEIYTPEQFKTHFKYICFIPNVAIDKDLSLFHFSLDNKIHKKGFNLYVNVIEWKNYLGTTRHRFYLIGAEYIFQNQTEKANLKLQERSKNYKLLNAIFDSLNSDGTLEEIYN